jgi:hypothetical protein
MPADAFAGFNELYDGYPYRKLNRFERRTKWRFWRSRPLSGSLDVVKVKIGDLVSGGRVRSRAIVVQQKSGRPVQFELLEPTRGSILAWLERRGGALPPTKVSPSIRMTLCCTGYEAPPKFLSAERPFFQGAAQLCDRRPARQDGCPYRILTI